ncbi:Methylmalonic aciduria and homocystinuria type D-like protein, mitochondrial-like isoform X2 [Oopsacas minuta]|uniref:Methylmalonic aciduria and homocystinuria type D-like protein, mitochondrial-like isoform X2 n=1 Tax=Oopsacas minuta TaxID=111878 RepID=A0AAV7JL57_9METZ|nr:Methylmalonic aciduria and homocystinuria type D-like protein, mitochondrial-like isoform X2 [Oopsacas minuta]
MSSYQLAKNLSMKTRMISYLPSLTALLQRVRTFHHPIAPVLNGNMPIQTLKADSSGDASDSCHSLKSSCKDKTIELAPKRNEGVSPNLFSIDKRFSLPSATGVPLCHILSPPPLDTATQYGSIDGLFEDHISKFCNQQFQKPFGDTKVEVLVQESPSFLLKSFMELIPGIPELTDKLSVICLSEHTINDMSKWSQRMAEEREDLTLNFINSAKEICARIEEHGFWADLIDPSSGQPFLGESGSDHMTEIDDRMRHFGFTIEDLGCCKCVRHATWGVNVFVGVIFTTAPTNSTIINSLIKL